MDLTFSRLRNIYDNWDDPEYAGVFADLLWRTLLVAAMIAIVGFGSYAARLFFEVTADVSSAGGQAGPISAPAQLDDERSALMDTVSIYADRKNAFQSLQTSPAQMMADPAQ